MKFLDPEDLYNWLCQVRSSHGQSSKLLKKVQLKVHKCPVLLWESEGSAPGVVYNPLIGYLTISLVNHSCITLTLTAD